LTLRARARRVNRTNPPRIYCDHFPPRRGQATVSWLACRCVQRERMLFGRHHLIGFALDDQRRRGDMLGTARIVYLSLRYTLSGTNSS
jgi:hypothetical protein